MKMTVRSDAILRGDVLHLDGNLPFTVRSVETEWDPITGADYLVVRREPDGWHVASVYRHLEVEVDRLQLGTPRPEH